MEYSLSETYATPALPRRRLLALSATLSMLCACAPEAGPLQARFSEEFQPGMPFTEAQQILLDHGATLSVSNAKHCEQQVRQSATATQLPPHGGPCIFGKIPISKNWLGGRTDLILQLVFDPENKLVDANFEEISSGF